MPAAQPGSDGAHGTVQSPGHLGVGEALPFSEEQCVSLCRRKLRQRVREAVDVVARWIAPADRLVQRVEVDGALDSFTLSQRTSPCAADVVGDRVEPRERPFGCDAALQERARIEKGRLHRIVGILVRTELAPAVLVDALSVERVERCRRLGCFS